MCLTREDPFWVDKIAREYFTLNVVMICQFFLSCSSHRSFVECILDNHIEKLKKVHCVWFIYIYIYIYISASRPLFPFRVYVISDQSCSPLPLKNWNCPNYIRKTVFMTKSISWGHLVWWWRLLKLSWKINWELVTSTKGTQKIWRRFYVYWKMMWVYDCV